jgi:hypothetical protein
MTETAPLMVGRKQRETGVDQDKIMLFKDMPQVIYFFQIGPHLPQSHHLQIVYPNFRTINELNY